MDTTAHEGTVGGNEVEFGGISGITGVSEWNLLERDMEESLRSVFFCRLGVFMHGV